MGRPTLYSGPPGKLPVLQMASPPLRAGLKGTELNTQPFFIKGKLHYSFILINRSPKQFYSVIIYSRSCCTKPVLICILVLNTKDDILKIVGNQTVSPPVFSPPWSPMTLIVENKGSHWGPATVWLHTFFKIFYFVFSTRIQINTFFKIFFV